MEENATEESATSNDESGAKREALGQASCFWRETRSGGRRSAAAAAPGCKRGKSSKGSPGACATNRDRPHLERQVQQQQRAAALRTPARRLGLSGRRRSSPYLLGRGPENNLGARITWKESSTFCLQGPVLGGKGVSRGASSRPLQTPPSYDACTGNAIRHCAPKPQLSAFSAIQSSTN